MSKNFLAAGALVISIGALPGVAAAQNVQEEVDKQIAKAIGDAVNARVTSQAVTEAAPPSSFWVTAGALSIKSNSPGAAFDLSIPTLLMGYDSQISEKAMAGVSGSFFATSGDLGAAKFDISGISVSPYFAYLFNKNFFGTAKLNFGYTYATTEVSGPGFSSDSYSSSYTTGLDFSMNGLYRPGNFLMKGRVGVGWSSTTTDTTTDTYAGCCFSSSTTTQDSSSTLYGAEADLGYFFAPRSFGFVGAQMSKSDEANSKQVYARVGFEQQFGKASALSLKYEKLVDSAQQGASEVKVQSFMLTFRTGF